MNDVVKNLLWEKHITFVDIEITSLKPNLDRIAELSVLKIPPDGSRECKVRESILRPRYQ
jgi:hypothetical protein